MSREKLAERDVLLQFAGEPDGTGRLPGAVAAWLACGRLGRQTARMEKFSLDAIARTQAEKAAAASSGRSAETVYGGHEHALRQTMVALTGGSSLDEHESPGEATVK